MTKRMVEIEDNLDQIVEDVQSELKDLVVNWIKENNTKPDLSNDIDYDGSFHEIVDTAVPIYTGEINDLFYLYGDEFEEAFDNAGCGDKEDKCWPSGWKPAAIYFYIEQKCWDWFNENIDQIFEENHKEELEETTVSVPDVP
jgi:hypothetical protein